MSDREDKKRPDQRVDPLLSLNIRNEIRKEIERATEKIERNMERCVNRLEKHTEMSVNRLEKHTEMSMKRIENKVDSVRSDLKEDIRGLDKRLTMIDVRTFYTVRLLSLIIGLLLFIGFGGILLLLLQVWGG